MRNRRSIPILRGISIAIITVALVLVVIAMIGYSRQRNNYPIGMKIAGVPVGGVDPRTAVQRVLQVVRWKGNFVRNASTWSPTSN